MSILTLTGVSKSFGGQKVLDGLTMAVSEHSVYGFLGKNGAGKTTTMKLIAGFLRPDDGTITVCGNLSDSDRARKASRSATCPMCRNSTLI